MSKRVLTFLITGFVLFYQFLMLKSLKLIQLSSGWDWKSDISGMACVLGGILMITGLVIHYRERKKQFKNSKEKIKGKETVAKKSKQKK